LSDTGSINGPGWGFGPPDQVPFEVMYPYIKNWGITVDPMDEVQSLTQREIDDFASQPGAPTLQNATPAQIAYALGVRSNIAYNYEFFSPWVHVSEGSPGTYIGSYSTPESQVTQPAHTLEWGDASIWNRVGGTPTGGGNWVIQTPCFLSSGGQYMQPMAGLQAAGELFFYGTGWDSSPTSWLIYGGLWPWYNNTSTTEAPQAQNGMVIIGFADSHTKAMPISQVTAGCDAYGSTVTAGQVTNPSAFIWATEQ
jgi:hypothetical protein